MWRVYLKYWMYVDLKFALLKLKKFPSTSILYKSLRLRSMLCILFVLLYLFMHFILQYTMMCLIDPCIVRSFNRQTNKQNDWQCHLFVFLFFWFIFPSSACTKKSNKEWIKNKAVSKIYVFFSFLLTAPCLLCICSSAKILNQNIRIRRHDAGAEWQDKE